MINFSGIPSSKTFGKIARMPLQCLPKNLVVPVIQGRLKGKRWLAGAHTHGCWLGSYELEKQSVFERLVKPGDIVFDIGANVGFYTLLASTMIGPTGHVYAFEPLPRNLEYLRRHIALNKLTNVTVFDSAVSEQTGVARFGCGTSATGALSDDGEFSVKTIALDELDASLPPPSLLKIDVEGAELSVLRGAQRLLKLHKPSILLATHGREVQRQCCDLLLDRGYNVQSLDHRPLNQTDEVQATPLPQSSATSSEAAHA